MVPPAARGGRRPRRLLRPRIAQAAAAPGADRYRKHSPARAHLWLLVLHGRDGRDSLRQSHAALTATPRDGRRLGLPAGLSSSQLARSSRSRPAGGFERLLAALAAAARRRPADPEWAALARVQAVDSTFLALSAKGCPGGQRGRHRAGVRLQCGLALADAIPAHLQLTTAATNDHAALKARDLAPWAGWALPFDLGYYGHKQLQRLREAEVHFVTRLHPQAAYRVTAAADAPAAPTPEGDTVLADETVALGSPNNRRGAGLPGPRPVTSRNRAGHVHPFVADRADLTAGEVVQPYRRRWQIELFFRWLKRQLKLLHPLGHSPEAVWPTVLGAAIVAVLATLTADLQPPAVTDVAWLRALAAVLRPTRCPGG